MNRVDWRLRRILDNKRASSKSLFTPSALLREARRQKGLAERPGAVGLHF